MPAPHRLREAALAFTGFAALFTWLYAGPLLEHRLLVESDLYEYYLPIFLAPITTWSPFEFGGLPAFADPGDFTAYPLHFIFARLVGAWTSPVVSWTALAISAYVLAACFTYAYVRHVTGSMRAAAFAGLAYGMSEALIERLPHSGTLHAAAWLPLILLAVEHQHDQSSRRWLAIGAFAVGSCFLAGHPQPAIYIYVCCGLYAVTSGLVRKAARLYYARVAAVFALGCGLVLIKGLPFIEASFGLERQQVNFSQFASHSNSPAQMLSLLFPSILHEGREAPTYVGLVTVVLAMVGGLSMWKASWRARFWIVLTVCALLLGMGDSTPLASLAYYIPLYWKFRVVARHLILAAFGLCVLAGFGVAAVEHGLASRRVLWSAGAALVVAVAATAALLLVRPALFPFEPRMPLPWTPPGWNTAIWVQFLICALTVVCVALAARAGTTRAWWVGAALLLAGDALYSLPYGVTVTGLVPITMPASAARPSVHARRLAEAVAPLHQRVLAPGGTHQDAVLPAAWARVWRIPIAGGYGPMLLASQAELAQMGTNGAVRKRTLAPDDVGLDLLAVRRIVMRADDLAESDTFTAAGTRWSSASLDVTVGRADCNHPYPRSLTLPLPAVDIAEVAVVGHLRCAEDLTTGTDVARIELREKADVRYVMPLRAGVEIADRALAIPTVAARARHRAAPIFDDPDAVPNDYLVRVRPPAPVKADRLVINVPPMPGWFAIDRITIIDAAGASHPLPPTGLFLSDTDRWREVERFSTSRATDRDRDETVGGETEFVVFDNRRARPRAWMVSEVVALAEYDLADAIRHSQLPDGRAFDPASMALVAATASAATRRFQPGQSTVTVRSISDGHAALDVDSGGGFLVWSEAFYPGWRASVDGRPVPIERTDVHLQGVTVPAGRHRVEFAFTSTTLRVGAAISAVSLVGCLALLAIPSGRRRPQSQEA